MRADRNIYPLDLGAEEVIPSTDKDEEEEQEEREEREEGLVGF